MIKDQLEKTIALPKGWASGKLGEIAKYINGRAFKPKEWEKKGLPIIRIQNLNKPEATYNYSSKVFEERYLVKHGELLFAWSASLGAYIWKNQDAWLNQHIFKVLPEKGINKMFLYYALTSITSELYAKAHGSGMVHVTKKKFENTEIGIPPLPEQHRIVAKIESLFTQLDKGVEQLTAIQQQLKTYRQAVLKAAFAGKLTAAWREAHQPPPASALLEQIKVERERQYERDVAEWKAAVREWEGNGKKPGKPRKLVDYPELTEDDIKELADLPEGWLWVPLSQIVNEVFDGPFGSNLKSSDYVPEGVRVIRLENIGSLKFNDEKTSFISEEKYRTIKKHTVGSGDIIFSSFIADETRVVVLPSFIKKAINKADCFCIRIEQLPIERHFVSLFLSSKATYNQLVNLVHGATRPRINTTQLKSCLIPLCSFEEQHQIVQEIESRLSICDQLEKAIAASLQQAEALRQSILKKAFEGKLVPQDPADEPAGVLLERIRKQKKQEK